MKKYILTPDATEDLIGINIYTHDEWGPKQMHLFHEELTIAFQRLADSRDLITPNYVVCFDSRLNDWNCKFIRHRYHQIFFEWIDEGVLILNIVHNRSDFIQKINK